MERRPDDEQAEEPIEELEARARQENPDPITQREAFELDLEEEGRSDEGATVDLEHPR